MNFFENYLQSVTSEFLRYKTLGEKVFEQLSDEEILWKQNNSDNSIAIIIKHLSGNLLSRWTDFLTEDGEKPWRNRDIEFKEPPATKDELLTIWAKGWECLFNALDSITVANLNTRVAIRNEAHTPIEAINRQLAHYANHIGQIIILGKMLKGEDWITLSVPKGGSEAFNRRMRT
ncbi:MAG: DUF1572 family protein [Bacteroidota bacterium]